MCTLISTLAYLTSTALARPDMRPADITAPASLATATSSAMSQIQSTVAEEGWEVAAQTEELELRRRKDDEDKSEDEDSSKSSHDSATEGSGRETVLTISVTKPASEATSTSEPLPSAWDGTLSTDFTSEPESNCPSFLRGVLSNPTFDQCYPLSMMLQVSVHHIRQVYMFRF